MRYRDARCSDSVELAEQTLEHCPTPPARVASLWRTVNCDPVPTAYRLGDEWPAMAPLFEETELGCRPVDRQIARYYAVGAEIPLSSFAVFTHRIEEPVRRARERAPRD